MKTENQIKKMIKELKMEKLKKFSGVEGRSSRYIFNKKIEILEWVLKE